MRNGKDELAGRCVMQMLKGLNGEMPVITEEQKDEFFAKHLDLAKRVMDLLLPNPDRTYSAAIGAVIAKAALKYGEEKAFKLLTTMRDCTFNGEYDPARLLHLLIKNSRGLSNQHLYARAVSATRAFCEGRTIMELKKAKSDILECSIKTEPSIKLSTKKNWWEEVKPIHRSDHFLVFFKAGEWVIQRKWEIAKLHPDGTVEISRRDEPPKEELPKEPPKEPEIPKVDSFVGAFIDLGQPESCVLGTDGNRENAGRWSKQPEEDIAEIKPFYSVLEASKFTGIAERTPQSACYQGRIPATRPSPHKWQISYEVLVQIKQHGLPKLTLEQRKIRPVDNPEINSIIPLSESNNSVTEKEIRSKYDD